MIGLGADFEALHAARMAESEKQGEPVGLTSDRITGWIEKGELEESSLTEEVLGNKFNAATYGRHHRK